MHSVNRDIMAFPSTYCLCTYKDEVCNDFFLSHMKLEAVGGTPMPHTVVWAQYYCSVQLGAFKESTSYGKSNAAVCSI